MASVIKIKNSTGSVPPTGLTFGEPAFVQGTGLTANRLYMGNSTSTSVWVGAEISTTGTWTDNAAKTTLATQYATDQRIASQISGSGVSSFNGATGAVQGVSAAVGSTYLTVSGSTGSVTFTNTGVQTFNGLTGAVGGVTTSVANTFTALQTFSAGISASSGVTFSKDITVNSITVGRGGGGVDTNVALGPDALASNTTGGSNVGVGQSALTSNTEGNSNVGVGEGALATNTTGGSNIGVGRNALGANTEGFNNIGVGEGALYSNTEGFNNIGVGVGALEANTTGSNKTAIGYNAGRYAGTGTTNLTTGTGGIYIGYQARGSTLAQTNEIVIGVDALGLGSNTAVIGATLQSAATIYGLLNLPSGLSTTGATFTGNISAPNIVSSFNGATGAVQGVSAAVGSTYLTVSGSTGSVTFTNTGVQTFNGLTGAVTGLTSGGPLGTPASGTLTNCTGLPVATGISGLCGGIATFLAQSTSANLAAAMSDETGTGVLVFATSPTLTTPLISTITNSGTITLPTLTSTLATLALSETLSNKTLSGVTLGTPASGTLTNCTSLPVSSGISGLCGGIATFLAQSTSANLAAAMSDETGSGALVFANTPTLVNPALGTPSALVGTNITGTAAGFTVGSASLATNSLSLGGTAASGWAQLASPTFTGTVNTSNLIVGGDLTVSGTTTTINSTTLTINDFNIIVGATLSGTGATGAAIATGAGIAVGTGTGISFAYEHSSTSWLSTVDLNILTGKTYKIAGAEVLSSTTLGTSVVTSSLTSVGTLTTFVIDAGTF